MKKIAALLLAILLGGAACLFSACGQTGGASSVPPPQGGGQEDDHGGTVTPEPPKVTKDDLLRALEEGTASPLVLTGNAERERKEGLLFPTQEMTYYAVEGAVTEQGADLFLADGADRFVVLYARESGLFSGRGSWSDLGLGKGSFGLLPDLYRTQETLGRLTERALFSDLDLLLSLALSFGDGAMAKSGEGYTMTYEIEGLVSSLLGEAEKLLRTVTTGTTVGELYLLALPVFGSALTRLPARKLAPYLPEGYAFPAPAEGQSVSDYLLACLNDGALYDDLTEGGEGTLADLTVGELLSMRESDSSPAEQLATIKAAISQAKSDFFAALVSLITDRVPAAAECDCTLVCMFDGDVSFTGARLSAECTVSYRSLTERAEDVRLSAELLLQAGDAELSDLSDCLPNV